MNTNNTRIDTRIFPAIRGLKGPLGETMREHDTAYRGFVTKTNEIFQRLGDVDRGAAHPVYSDLRSLLTELPAALAAVKSYELFFTHLGGTSRNPHATMTDQIRKDFGTIDAFKRELTAAAIASRGWVAVIYDLDLKRLVCVIGDSPEKLTVWNVAPVIVLEVSERFLVAEFGRDRVRYVETLMEHLDWGAVERNLEDAIGLHPAGKSH